MSGSRPPVVLPPLGSKVQYQASDLLSHRSKIRKMAGQRLDAELEAWGWMRPAGFAVQPSAKDRQVWICGVPGPKQSSWRGGLFRVVL